MILFYLKISTQINDYIYQYTNKKNRTVIIRTLHDLRTVTKTPKRMHFKRPNGIGVYSDVFIYYTGKKYLIFNQILFS